MDIPVSKVAQDPEDRARTHFTGDADRGRGRFAPGRLHRRQGRGFAFGCGDQPEPEGADVFRVEDADARAKKKVIKMAVLAWDDGSEHTLEEVGQSFAVTRETAIRQDRSEGRCASCGHPVSFAQAARAFLEGPSRELPIERTEIRSQALEKKRPELSSRRFFFFFVYRGEVV